MDISLKATVSLLLDMYNTHTRSTNAHSTQIYIIFTIRYSLIFTAIRLYLYYHYLLLYSIK
jgi:hypothetical protein